MLMNKAYFYHFDREYVICFRIFLKCDLRQDRILNSNRMEKYRQNQMKSKMNQCDKSIVDYQEIVQLLSTIQKLICQNKSLYHSLLDYDPHFAHDLYRPKNQNGLSRQIQKQLKLKQIDRLLDEQSFLTQKREQAMLKKQFAQENKDDQIRKNKSEFNYHQLRRMLSSLKTNNLSSHDRVDQLNKLVKQVKTKVDIEITNEKLWMREENQLQTPYIPSKKYSKLQNEYYQLETQLASLSKNNKNLYNLICEKDCLIQQARQRESQLNKQLQICKQKLNCNYKYIKELQTTLQINKNDLNKVLNKKGLIFQNQVLNLSIAIECPNIQYKIDQTERSLQQILSFLQKQDSSRQTGIPDISISELPILNITNSDRIVKRILSDRNWDSREHPQKKNRQPIFEGTQNKDSNAFQSLKNIMSKCETERVINTQTQTVSTVGKTTGRKNPRFRRSKQTNVNSFIKNDEQIKQMLILDMTTFV